MDRTRFGNKFLKNMIPGNKLTCNTQINFYISLVRKVVTDYYNNLDQRTVTDNKNCSGTRLSPFSQTKEQEVRDLPLSRKIIS